MAEVFEEKVAKFDPSKNYTWNVGATFKLDGKEFELLNVAIRQSINLLAQAQELLNRVIEVGINAGVIVEATIEPEVIREDLPKTVEAE